MPSHGSLTRSIYFTPAAEPTSESVLLLLRRPPFLLPGPAVFMIFAGHGGQAERSGDRRVTIVSIQSQVVHGHVGNSAALFALQLLGIETAAVPTALFSNHPRYSSCYGTALDAALVRDLLRGIEDRGLIERCKILMSGYLGSPGNAAAVSEFVARAKARNPRLVYLCDPVMGDTGVGFYVQEELRAAIAEALVPLADILTPSQFELEGLTGRKLTTLEGITAAARGLGPETVAVTGRTGQRNSAWHNSDPGDRTGSGLGHRYTAPFLQLLRHRGSFRGAFCRRTD
jgi:hydroxymethylpyrimidine/phosphomethylpyrimidine kinase